MAYIAGLIITGLFFLTLHYFTELTKGQKITITIVILALVLSAAAFNSYSNAQSQKMLEVVMKFNQHKDIECEGITLNDKNFTLSIGTYTFIGKQDTPYYNRMVNASTCK